MPVKYEPRVYDTDRDGPLKLFGGRIVGSPLPLKAEATKFIECGSIWLGVEYRYHTDNEEGVAVHVVNRARDVEYLRFDCFEDRPHYHYIHQREGFHDRFFVDTAAEGDPVVWMLDRLRTRLAPMLEQADAGPDVTAGFDALELERALLQVSIAVYAAISHATHKAATAS